MRVPDEAKHPLSWKVWWYRRQAQGDEKEDYRWGPYGLRYYREEPMLKRLEILRNDPRVIKLIVVKTETVVDEGVM